MRGDHAPDLAASRQLPPGAQSLPALLRRLEARIPPPLVLLACAALAWLLSCVAAAAAVSASAGLTWSAIAAVAAGLALNLLPKLAFRRAGTTVNPLAPERSTQLVVHGLHRWSRNPMYLGHALILVGIALLLRNAVALTAVPLYVACVTRFQIVPEERALRARFGRRYVDYAARVRRWL
ncbi:isoprenylcysteine carboxylmethyltransferase family protein [Xanthomonas sp. XNM01]|uniref:methyltransferase n=1 Tax=Xanthomonas sp. XNM01 TaxID=2769289 RepID=UPI0017860483|nr:isoprenylcysteine carboxylmethyltransferase family protein [Xanthomonas sp. XNM01]